MSYTYSDTPNCCNTASAELKLYQAFIFSIPIFFTLILLFLFYLFYLRRCRVDWNSMRMRLSYQNNPRLSESGLKKELREMLPILVFKETFSITDTQCSVCLGDYQAEDRLQQIPACGHTFHMVCIDHWLATHPTCPLCRLSLTPVTKFSSEPSDHLEDPTHGRLAVDIEEVGEHSERMSNEERSNCTLGNEEICNAQLGHSGEEPVTVLDIEAHDCA